MTDSDTKVYQMVASFIFQSKMGYVPNFNKMHPKERDFWYARAQQAAQGDAHTWAVDEVMVMLGETRMIHESDNMDEA